MMTFISHGIVLNITIAMSVLEASTKVVAAEDTLSTNLDGESVVLHTGTGQYYGFNSVGTEIWESLSSPRTVDDVVQHIAMEYDVTHDKCREDVESLVAELIDKDLVEVVEE